MRSEGWQAEHKLQKGDERGGGGEGLLWGGPCQIVRACYSSGIRKKGIAHTWVFAKKQRQNAAQITRTTYTDATLQQGLEITQIRDLSRSFGGNWLSAQ